jgi:molybdate-binding protein
MAAVGIGMRTAAEQVKLGFIPLVRERYFFALHTAALEDGLMARLLAALREPGYHRLVDALPGYDAARTGDIESLQDAFRNTGNP